MLVDTGTLLRFTYRPHPDNKVIRDAVRKLRVSGVVLRYTPQNVVEYWNVATHPTTARGGFGLTLREAERSVALVRRLFALLPDDPKVLEEWLRIVVNYRVSGVQVHDARLVAFMNVYGVRRILTLNPTDFARYTGITAVQPPDV